MKITIATITARKNPRYAWLVGGLAAQAQASDVIELIVVDRIARVPAEIGLDGAAADSVLERVVVVPPKPNLYQGPHRVTNRDLCAMSNARNTAVCLATHDYIVFLDDGCWLGPTWLETVRRGERERTAALVGPYDMHETHGLSIDHRSRHSPHGKANCGGAWFFTGNVALPLAWVLEVGGFEEGCDPMGYEDCLMGVMLSNRGRRIDFDAAMRIQQDRKTIIEDGRHPLQRIDKGRSPDDKSHALNRRFARHTHTEFTPDLSALRELVRAGGAFPIPDPNADHRDWYDGQPIKEM